MVDTETTILQAPKHDLTDWMANKHNHEIVDLTDEDIGRYWLAHDSLGIRIPEKDEIQVLPDYKGRVIFDPARDFIAGHDVASNRILVGPRALNYSEGVLGAILRHEGSHNIFANLTAVEQRAIVAELRTNHLEALKEYYLKLRESYSEEYFSREEGRLKVELAHEIGRGHHFQEHMLVWNGDTLEDANIVRVTDEMLAFAATGKTQREFFPKHSHFSGSIEAANTIVDKLQGNARSILSRNGFLAIDSRQYLTQLQQDPLYRDAREHAAKNK